jgi:PAS domain S-box-containing protein
VENAFLDRLRAGEIDSYTVEERLVAADGAVRRVSTRASLSLPRRAATSEWPRFVLRRVLDVTEHRRTEAERDRLFNLSPDLIAVLGLDGRVRRGNPAFAHVLGWSDVEVLGRPLVDLTHPDDRKSVLAGVERLARGEPVIDAEVRGVRPDGTTRWLRASGVPIPEEDVIYVWMRDVSARKAVEAALHLSEARFRRVFEDSPVGIAMVDGQRRIMRANAALCELLGYSEDELVGRRSAELMHPDDVALDTQLAERLFAGDIPGYVIEKRYRRKDGQLIWGRLRASMIRGEDGESLYRLAMIEDITEEREADEAHRELEAMKDAFVRVVSHDLQNPLVAIAGLAEILATDPADLSPEEKRRLLGRIALHADRLKGMVTSFLDLDRLHQGALSAHRIPTDLTALVRRVLETCELGDRPLSVEVAPGEGLIDAELTEHILTNLLENAAAHTPPGTSLWVGVGHEPDGVSIVVEDAGPGVPADLRTAVFELFRTADPEARRTGVGLWVVARFAELQGGRAWVEDRPGGGASFRVSLPTGEPDRDK